MAQQLSEIRKVDDDERPGRPVSARTEGIVQRNSKILWNNGLLTIWMIADMFSFSRAGGSFEPTKSTARHPVDLPLSIIWRRADWLLA